MNSETFDLINPEPAIRLGMATGDPRHLEEGDDLPLLWHWAYFPDLRVPDALGVDGHPAREDEFVGRYPCRMAGGGSVEALAPFRIGVTTVRRSVLERVTEHSGRRGPLAVVRVGHHFWQEDREVRREKQTMIYRNMPNPDSPNFELTRYRAVLAVLRRAPSHFQSSAALSLFSSNLECAPDSLRP